MYHRNGVYGWIDWCLPSLAWYHKDQYAASRHRNGYCVEGLAVLLGGIFTPSCTDFHKTLFGQKYQVSRNACNLLRSWFPWSSLDSYLKFKPLPKSFWALSLRSHVKGCFSLFRIDPWTQIPSARVDFANNEHNSPYRSSSIAAGVGPNNSNSFVSMPTAFQMFFLQTEPSG